MALATQSRKDILLKVQRLVPPMLESFHKGQLGRVAVIGGSEDYTGAPYFSAMASARLGCDMSHVICEPGAAAVIKTYSPNLMVHPYMRQSSHMSPPDNTPDSVAQKVIDMLPRVHSLVIGPGLGRDVAMQETAARVVQEARKKGLSFVLDADGLLIAQERSELIKGYKECILTPNVVEFGRLCKAHGVQLASEAKQKEEEMANKVAELSKNLDGVTVLAKGASDYISNGVQTLVSSGEGGLKRSGGQGDTLTGSLATLLAWRSAYHEKVWDHENDISEEESLALVAFGGSAITRECSRTAFKEKGRSLQAGDLTDRVYESFLTIIGEPSKL